MSYRLRAVRGAVAMLCASITFTFMTGCIAQPGDAAEETDVFALGSAVSALSNGQVVRIVAVHSGLVLEVAGVSRDHGAELQQWEYWKGENQRWKLRSVGSTFELLNLHSDKCMGVSRASTAQQARVLQGTCSGALDQRWMVRAQPDGTYQIANDNSKRCLDVMDVSMANGGKLQQYTCSTQANQRFRVEPVDGAGVPIKTAPVADAFVRRDKMRLVRNQQPFRFVGVNTYYLAGLTTKYPVACGWPQGRDNWQQKVDAYFDAVKSLGGNAVRFWAFQVYAGPQGNDFAFLERLIRSAQARGIYLIPALVNAMPHCEPGDSYLSDAFFSGDYKRAGYRQGYALSYRDYVARITAQFAKEPTILMWQMGNELITSYSENRVQVASAFAADIASLIKANAPNTLVSVGTIGDTNGGFGEWDYSGYHNVHANPNIDVLEVHDYFDPNVALHAKVKMTWSVALQLAKPLFVGEQGVSIDERGNYDQLIRAKLKASAALGTAGHMIWHFDPNYASAGYSFNGASTDALSRVFRAEKALFAGAAYPSGLTSLPSCSVRGERGCDVSGCCGGLTCQRWDEFGSYLCQ